MAAVVFDNNPAVSVAGAVTVAVGDGLMLH